MGTVWHVDGWCLLGGAGRWRQPFVGTAEYDVGRWYRGHGVTIHCGSDGSGGKSGRSLVRALRGFGPIGLRWFVRLDPSVADDDRSKWTEAPCVTLTSLCKARGGRESIQAPSPRLAATRSRHGRHWNRQGGYIRPQLGRAGSWTARDCGRARETAEVSLGALVRFSKTLVAVIETRSMHCFAAR
jgi:hypothetical protein